MNQLYIKDSTAETSVTCLKLDTAASVKMEIGATEILITKFADCDRNISNMGCFPVCNNGTDLSGMFNDMMVSEANVPDSSVVAVQNIPVVNF